LNKKTRKKYNGFLVKNFTLKEHDFLMEEKFKNSIEECWDIQNIAYQIKIKKLNDYFSFFWGKYDKYNNEEIKSIKTKLKMPVLIFSGMFLKTLFDFLLKNPTHRMFLYFYNDFILKDLGRNIAIDFSCIEYSSVEVLTKLKIKYLQIDSRIFSFFHLNNKVINNKTKLNVYIEKDYIYYLIIVPKKNEERIYGLKVKNLL